MLLVLQQDQPGIVAGVSSMLAKDDVNISFMTVGRTGKNEVSCARLLGHSGLHTLFTLVSLEPLGSVERFRCPYPK